MKTLTIKQPWASLIALGEKKIETRSWRTKYRGPLLIHAGKTIDKEAFCRETIKSTLAKYGILELEDLPTGCIIAKANLSDVYRVEKVDHENKYAYIMNKEGYIFTLAQGKEYDFGGYIAEPGKYRYGWKLKDVKPINPIYCKGQLNLWSYEGDNFESSH